MVSTVSLGRVAATSDVEIVLVQQLGGAKQDEGRRVLVGQGLAIGRDNPLFSDGYPTLSRRHAELTFEGEALRITDRGSRHGTHVNGRRVERAAVSVGDFIELGGVGFVVTEAPAAFVPPQHPRFAFASHAFASLLDTLAKARTSRRPLVIAGEPGVGKSALAQELGPDHVVFDHLDEADTAAQHELLGMLRKAEADPGAPRVVILSCVPPAELSARKQLLDAIFVHIQTWVLRVPPLRERPEDILPIVRAELGQLTPGQHWELHPTLVSSLLAARWPGNVRALQAEVERLRLSASGPCLIGSPSEAGVPREASRTTELTVVASDGSWFQTREGAREDLGGRRVLRAVLCALLDARKRPAGAVSSRDIARLVWRGEKILPRAAANRVYVAVTTLRKLGFGPSIESTGEGYRLAEDEIEVVEVNGRFSSRAAR